MSAGTRNLVSDDMRSVACTWRAVAAPKRQARTATRRSAVAQVTGPLPGTNEGTSRERERMGHLDATVVVKSNETGCVYEVGCGWLTGWLIQAASGSLGGRGRRVKRSGCWA